MTRRPEPESLLPLTAVAFEILLTLSDGDCHGYHIMQEVERRTAGAIVLHPGTLYRTLARLLEASLIDERGVQLTVLQDERCIALMRRFISEHPELWFEDIGTTGEDR